VKRRLAAALVGLALVAPSGVARASTAPSPAAQKAGIDATIQQVNGELDEVDATEAGLLARLDAATAAQAGLNARAAQADARLQSAEADLSVAQGRLDGISARLDATRQLLTRTEASRLAALARLRSDALAEYVEGQDSILASWLLVDYSSDPNIDAKGYVDALVDAHAGDAARYQALKERQAIEASQLGAQQEQALAERNRVADAEQTAAGAADAAAAARSALVAQRAALDGLYSEASATKADLEARLADLQAQSDSIARLLQQEEAGQSGAVAGSGQLLPPVPGAPITSPFGMRMDPITHQMMLHSGVDFGAPEGTPIHAAADGTVVSAGPLGGYGNATIIDHGGGLATLYGHQEEILVTVGQTVSRGQVIGLVGCTGWCTGPHVHFEVRVHGTPVDPLPYL